MRNEKGQFVKGQRASPSTEFKKGQHWRVPKLYWEKDWLEHEYCILGKSALDIATEQGCTGNNILYFLQKHEIPRRTVAEARVIKHWGASGPANAMYGRVGRDNPNWRGGVSPERQAFYSSREWASAVILVWQRDEAICQRCGKQAKKHGEFHIHHIVSFAAEELRCEPDNLVLLCPSCHHWVHSKANVDNAFIKGGD